MTSRRRPFRLRNLFCCAAVILTIVAAPGRSEAHQQPTTLAVLDVGPSQVAMTLSVPLSELELAFGHDVTKDPETSLAAWRPAFADYLTAHVRPVSPDGRPWSVAVADMRVEKAEQSQSGPYQEITASLLLTPPEGASTRHFALDYDVIMHQVVSHKAVVSVRNDWETGRADGEQVEVGVIKVDTRTTEIFPLEIDLERGGLWDGFRGMVALGMQHIREGTDHLLFLLVLLLPAALRPAGRRWGAFGGSRYAISRLLTTVTAFTVGHSVTLLVGALGILRLPQQPVEVLVAFSILVSAAHAIRPLFPGKEPVVAAGFGLVHGLAFATALSDLHLSAGPMALSVLGFNVGVELMQLFVIALVMPWLILLSLTPAYSPVRVASASLAAVAALGWIASRVTGEANAIDASVQGLTRYAPLAIPLLALVAVPAYVWSSRGGRLSEQQGG